MKPSRTGQTGDCESARHGGMRVRAVEGENASVARVSGEARSGGSWRAAAGPISAQSQRHVTRLDQSQLSSQALDQSEPAKSRDTDQWEPG